MTTIRIGVLLAALLAGVGCSKKDDQKGDGASAAKEGKGEAKSGLAWTPDNYDAMSAPCKKALACCLEVATSEGAKTPEDYNLKCSGPALWKDADCETDLASRVSSAEAASKPVPAACK